MYIIFVYLMYIIFFKMYTTVYNIHYTQYFDTWTFSTKIYESIKINLQKLYTISYNQCI